MGKFQTVPSINMRDLEDHLLLVTARRWVELPSRLDPDRPYTVIESDVVDLDDPDHQLGLVRMYGHDIVSALSGLQGTPLLARLVCGKRAAPRGCEPCRLPHWRLAPATEADERCAEAYLAAH